LHKIGNLQLAQKWAHMALKSPVVSDVSIVCCADFRLPLPGTGLFGRPETGPFPPPSFPQLQGLYRARTAGGHARRGRSAQGTGGQGRQVRQGWAVGHAAPRLREIQRVGSLAQWFAMKCLELLEICRVG